MKKLIIKMIEYYQKNISPNRPKSCRFLPTCSEYAKECYQKFNFFYATWLSVVRLLKCNPFHKMAYDPVPEKKCHHHKKNEPEGSI